MIEDEGPIFTSDDPGITAVKKYTKNIWINCRGRGTTLFEVMLYIALFSVIFTIAALSYFSIIRHIDKVQAARQRTEIHFMVYEILRYNLDSRVDGGEAYQPKVSDFSRVLKYYPAFSMTSVAMEMHHDYRFDIDIASIEYDLSGKQETIRIYTQQ